MHRFFITIKKDGKIFGNFDKIGIDLNTSGNLVNQADEITKSLLDSFDVQEEYRKNISWKIFQYKESKYMMVSQTKNWVEY